MSYKEWQAIIELVGAAAIAAWLILDTATNGPGSTIGTAAMKLLWFMGAVIVFNIVATIVVTILVSIARRETFKDERADERDRLIEARGGRNGYVVGSITAAIALVALAFGAEPVLAAYALFAAPMLAGMGSALSRIVYYRLG